MAAFLDNCRFIAISSGATDWTFASPVGGCQSPQAAGAVNGTKYKFRAESADLTQWEIAEGAYTAASVSFARTSVLYNSLGTGTAVGQSGTGAKINFAVVPQVAIIGIKEDLLSIEEANSFTATQQAQARSNINAASSLRTRTVLITGSGNYTPPSGCKAINVRMVGAGGGGGGGCATNAASGNLGGVGGGTTFGSLTAGGGGGGATSGFAPQGGGGASGGDVNIPGSSGQPGWTTGGGELIFHGFSGAVSHFGGAAAGGWPGTNGFAAIANSGSGGGGGSGAGGPNGFGGLGGGAGGYVEKLFSPPAAFYAYAIGAGGGGGAPNSGASAGGAGGSGIIIIDEYY
jgi:hypothetical protein